MREGQKTKLARRLRGEANYPELAAWNALRALRAHGIAVRRQHPIGPYIVDFAIVKRKLAIEIDGGVHRLDEVCARDANRDVRINELGWRIVRIPSETAASTDHLLEIVQRELGL